jgi:hypothetical protein
MTRWLARRIKRNGTRAQVSIGPSKISGHGCAPGLIAAPELEVQNAAGKFISQVAPDPRTGNAEICATGRASFNRPLPVEHRCWSGKQKIDVAIWLNLDPVARSGFDPGADQASVHLKLRVRSRRKRQTEGQTGANDQQPLPILKISPHINLSPAERPKI